MLKKFSLVLLVGIMLILQSGLSLAGEEYTVAFVPGQITEPFYISARYGAEEIAEEYNINLVWEGSKEWDYTKQTQIVESLLIKGIDALIIAPTDENVMKQPLKKVVESGIPVIALDTSIADKSLLNLEITSDNRVGGRQAAEIMAELIGGKGKVVIQNTEPGVTTTDQRQNAFEDTIKEKYPEIEVVNTYFCNEDRNKAASQIQNAMLANPDLKGVFGTCTNATIGAAKGLEMAKASDVLLVGYDADPAEIKALKNQQIDALIVQKPFLMGRLAVEYAYQILTGEGDLVPQKVILDTVVATPENMDSEKVSKFFYPVE